jgi:hypothetical protein
VLPFATGLHTSAILSQVEQDTLEMAYKEVPTEPLAKVIYYHV